MASWYTHCCVGVFHLANDSGMKWSATINYKVKAEVDIPGMKNDLKVNRCQILCYDVDITNG